VKRLSKMIGLLVSTALFLGVAQQSKAQTVCSNQTGTNNGFFYSFFLSSGSACMTMTGNFGGGNYSTTWSLGSSGNMVAGKGWNPGSTSRVVGYNAGNFSPGSNGYLALYGWSTNPPAGSSFGRTRTGSPRSTSFAVPGARQSCSRPVTSATRTTKFSFARLSSARRLRSRLPRPLKPTLRPVRVVKAINWLSAQVATG